ncbi:hypothetical protein QQF40_14475 [Cobetia sp. LC6]|uniref:hypothetical protein n=1 Tax=Cobetia sp. LC6 TaxID=3050947 RepID=UPI002552DF13|nr:hypothetical protein [Cobetia sp. LC6]MDL2192587.1 hypothetical protein [Cobetia sp. LC6]
MDNMSENEIRDYIFSSYGDDFLGLVEGVRPPISWQQNGFPTLSFFMRRSAEKKINRLIDALGSLSITAKELRLKKVADSTTRIDLFGNSEGDGLTIIELKKSNQTERQAFTELLGYANHFCSLFPGVSESCMTSVLVAPMENRVVRDAYTQELLINNKNIVAFVPNFEGDKLSLNAWYPKDTYYSWFEENIFRDESMLVVAISFPVIEGWFDTDLVSEDDAIPEYTKSALNTISSLIAGRLETEKLHSFVYARQMWGSVSQGFPYPNTIFVVCVNPFSSLRTSEADGEIVGASDSERLEAIQGLYDQFQDGGEENWIDSLEGAFRGMLIRNVKDEFEKCFIESGGKANISYDISSPLWSGIKANAIESVYVHNLDVYATGLIRDIYSEYMQYVLREKYDPIYYSDDLPKFFYQSQREWFPLWMILNGIGLDGDDE